jgi:sugar/nucleoside kinase (ribokinase family)
MERPTFCAVGDLMLDISATGDGHDARISVRPGGSAANAAVWADSCGAEATVIGFVGDDLAGQALARELEERNVRTSLSVIRGGSPTGATLLVDGHRRVDRGANAAALPELLPDPIEADAVLVSAYLPPAVVEAAVRRARAEWTAVDAALSDEPPSAPMLFIADERARALTGLEAEAAAAVLGRRYRLVCITRGREGAVAALDGRIETISAPEVLDGAAVGAGDALAAATLVALARGATLVEALGEGCRCGALVASSSCAWPVLRSKTDVMATDQRSDS